MWKSMIAENKFAGIQLFVDKDMKSGFVQEYLIKTTLQYILIDPNGNIISSNAPRPSSRKLIRLFSKLNI